MHQHRHTFARAVAQEIEDARIVEVPRPHVVADLHADMTARARPRYLAARRIDVLQGNLSERLQAMRLHRAERSGELVHPGGPRCCAHRVPRVAEHDRRCAHQLHVDPRRVHPRQARVRIPQARVHRPERLRAHHDVPGAVTVLGEPRCPWIGGRGVLPADAREQMRVDVDAPHVQRPCSAEALPGWTVPHAGHRRNAASS